MTQEEIKKKLIADAARDLFFERGYETTSMDEVARHAGVSKATVYVHFESKEKLLLQLIQDDIDCLKIARHEANANTACELNDRLKELAARFAAMFQDPRTAALHRLVISQANTFGDIAEAFYEAGPLRMENEVAKLLRHGVEKGFLRINDIHLAARQYLSLVVSTLPLRSVLSLQPASEVELQKSIESGLSAFMAAYATPAGKVA